MAEIPLAEFASYIENKNQDEIRKLFNADAKFKGFTVMMIAAMHTNGTWVLSQFSKEDKSKIDQRSSQELRDLANTLGLDVDDDILSDKNFTPLMLAVMFGPPDSVKVLLDAGAKPDLQTDRGFTAKMFATCRNDTAIKAHFTRNREFCDAYWGSCTLM
mmetsp:Transcript_33325/g.80942  ORF Transcript_33325/g.80942 Transcript_33325/m.80942 type:complete len:159 (+) Transcript_33325:217-693(+)|eukprot:CAMPEP_0114491172 /NCGR_PEP_ID=MMETSP0109-20121206/2851_1 /TAXON_ID=29199 /ORGANISM="Chlorarachnion reptans, Strain CCCM449" /LENGTH=158 /DNA_ID=CAMNT_0001667873 /DNA_START=163 /DNA_END=639 /DNA_ORIENTATION=-